MTSSAVEIIVRGFHIDVFGHVNNARYLEFLEDSRWHVFSQALTALPALGLSFVVVNVNINYRRPALLGETLLVDALLTKIGNTSFVVSQKVRAKNDPSIIFADAEVTAVLIDKKGKPQRLTDEIRERLFPEALTKL